MPSKPLAFPQSDCADCPIRHRAVCARCETDELEKLEAIKYYRSYEAGQTVVWAGDKMDFVASVVRGVASLTHVPDRPGWFLLATVVVLVDARAEAYLAPDDRDLSVVERSVEAAGALFAGFLDTDNLVGLAAVSSTELWLGPSAGASHRSRARELLATTDWNLTAIARHSGYRSLASFAHRFREQTGLPPGRWRRRSHARS